MDAQAGLCLCYSQTSEDRFSRVEAHIMTDLEYLKIATCPAVQKLMVYMEKMLIYIENHYFKFSPRKYEWIFRALMIMHRWIIMYMSVPLCMILIFTAIRNPSIN